MMIDGKYLYLRVGRKFESRRLGDGFERVFRGEIPNSEQRVVMVSLMCQLRMHYANQTGHLMKDHNADIRKIYETKEIAALEVENSKFVAFCEKLIRNKGVDGWAMAEWAEELLMELGYREANGKVT